MKAILLIDDHSLFRAGIAMVLVNGLRDVEIHQAASLEQALRLPGIAPTLILLDVQLQGLSGLEGIGLLLRKWPATRIVVVSAYDMPDRIEQARERGAVGFLSKTENPERLLQNVQVLLRDGAASMEVTGTKSLASLTPRQLEVLDLLSQGLSNKMIGRRLSLSEHTVRGHVQATLAALSASSRSEAVFVARRQGIIL